MNPAKALVLLGIASAFHLALARTDVGRTDDDDRSFNDDDSYTWESIEHKNKKSEHHALHASGKNKEHRRDWGQHPTLSVASPAPEPEALVMSLVGLAVVAAAVGWRRKRSSDHRLR
jgi:MYXO-CTERM domain-containing protein